MNTCSFLLGAVLTIVACGSSAAQTDPGKSAASRAGQLSLLPDQQVLEVGEQTVLRVENVPPVLNDNADMQAQAPTMVPNTKAGDKNIPVIYEVGSYKVLQGGGTLKFNNGAFIDFTYTAPSSTPTGAANSVVQVSVELVPHDIGNGTKGMAKVVLLLTLYIVHNETALVVHLPEAGFNDAKYITNTTSSLNMPGIDSRIPAAQAAQLQAQMAMAQQAMAQSQQQSGININAVTSNAKVFYKKEEDLTAIEFTQLGMQMDSGSVNLHPDPSAALSIIFKGKALTGSHSIDLAPEGVGFNTFNGRACTCGRDNKSDRTRKPLPCAGTVFIDKVTDKEISGRIQARIYYAMSNDNLTGYITGKFSALIVNQ